MWLMPHGHKEQFPKDYDDLWRVGQKAVLAVKSRHGITYQLGTGANLLYKASGISADWAYSKAGVKYSYIVELRPGLQSENGHGRELCKVKEAISRLKTRLS